MDHRSRHLREWMGDSYTKELFEKRKRRFHRMQLNPFASVLFGKYADHFQELKAKEEKPVTDDGYAPYKSEGYEIGRGTQSEVDLTN